MFLTKKDYLFNIIFTNNTFYNISKILFSGKEKIKHNTRTILAIFAVTLEIINDSSHKSASPIEKSILAETKTINKYSIKIGNCVMSKGFANKLRTTAQTDAITPIVNLIFFARVDIE